MSLGLGGMILGPDRILSYATTPIQVYYLVQGVAHNGQSLSTGDYGDPVISTANPYGNLQLHDSTGNYSNPTGGTWSTTGMVAPLRAEKYQGGGGDVSEYPINIGGESPDVATCNTIAALANGATGYVMMPHNCGQGGASYTVIEKSGSGNAYQSLINEIYVANLLNIKYKVGIGLLTHGEADAQVATGVYSSFLESYQSYLQTDAKAITGQTGTIPLIISQQNAFPAPDGTTAINQSALEQLAAAQQNPGTIILSGPKYQYPYYVDNAHLTATGYQLLGEKYGEVAYNILSGQGWTEFLPLSATATGTQVTIDFSVPVGPLQLSNAFSAPHQAGAYSAFASGFGFEAWMPTYGATPITILGVSVTGTQATISCATAPNVIAYAHTPDGGTDYAGGFPDGRCGLLRDSDTFVGPITHNAQPNWCPEFVIGV